MFFRFLAFLRPCFHRFCIKNLRKIGLNTFPNGTWWFHGAICLAMRAPRELLGAVEGSLGAKMGAQGCRKKRKELPRRPPRAPETTPTHGNHDPSALSTFQSLPGHDLSALPSDYERRDALDGAARARSIGPVDVSELPGAQNSNSGGVEAAILETFIVFELPEGPLGALQVDAPQAPTDRDG